MIACLSTRPPRPIFLCAMVHDVGLQDRLRGRARLRRRRSGLQVLLLARPRLRPLPLLLGTDRRVRHLGQLVRGSSVSVRHGALLRWWRKSSLYTTRSGADSHARGFRFAPGPGRCKAMCCIASIALTISCEHARDGWAHHSATGRYS